MTYLTHCCMPSKGH